MILPWKRDTTAIFQPSSGGQAVPPASASLQRLPFEGVCVKRLPTAQFYIVFYTLITRIIHTPKLAAALKHPDIKSTSKR